MRARFVLMVASLALLAAWFGGVFGGASWSDGHLGF